MYADIFLIYMRVLSSPRTIVYDNESDRKLVNIA